MVQLAMNMASMELSFSFMNMKKFFKQNKTPCGLLNLVTFRGERVNHIHIDFYFRMYLDVRKPTQ